MAETWDTYFQPTETLVWEGKPKAGVRGWPKLLLITIIALLFLPGGIAFFLLGLHSIADGAIGGLGALIASLVIFFLGVVAVREWVVALTGHRRIRYALSNRRAFIAKSFWRNCIESYPILPKTVLELERRNGYDNLWFHSRPDPSSEWGDETIRIGFEGLADAEEPYRLIRVIQTGYP